MMYNSKNAVIAEYENKVEDLVNLKPIPEIEERKEIVELLNEEYYQKNGNNLPVHLLSKLSDWILVEVLNDRDVDKVTNNEHPILSHRQFKRRDRRENSLGDNLMDYLNQKYVGRQDSLSKKTNLTIE